MTDPFVGDFGGTRIFISPRVCARPSACEKSFADAPMRIITRSGYVSGIYLSIPRMTHVCVRKLLRLGSVYIVCIYTHKGTVSAVIIICSPNFCHQLFKCWFLQFLNRYNYIRFDSKRLKGFFFNFIQKRIFFTIKILSLDLPGSIVDLENMKYHFYILILDHKPFMECPVAIQFCFFLAKTLHFTVNQMKMLMHLNWNEIIFIFFFN